MRIFCNNITGGNAIATAILAVGLTLASGTAFAVPDSEVNETFATRNIFGAGTTSVEGSLSQTIVGTLIFSTDDALVAGEVDQFTITGQAVGASFIAETSDGSGSPPGVDTVLGVFSDNTFTTLLLTDDDSGPGLGSRIEGVANGAGCAGRSTKSMSPCPRSRISVLTGPIPAVEPIVRLYSIGRPSTSSIS